MTPRTKNETFLLFTVYGFFILLVAVPLWYPQQNILMAILGVILVMVIAEAVYVLYFKKNTSLCDICKQTVCK